MVVKQITQNILHPDFLQFKSNIPTPLLELNGCSLNIGQDQDVVNF